MAYVEFFTRRYTTFTPKQFRPGGTMRPLKTVIPGFLAFMLFSWHINAQAQSAALQTAEPKRFALVIGNADYGKIVGTLPPLGSPCSDVDNRETDVKAVADALVTAKWEVKTLCNLTTSQLRDAIRDFNDRVLIERRAFGIIYFSGHGAQVAGTNYLFGIDADINEDEEVLKYEQNHYAPLFGRSAVSLDEAMRTLEPLWGKGVVVIVDACRTNPIIKELLKRKIDTARYPAASSQPTNIVYAFATALGEPAPDNRLGRSTYYSQVLADVIKTSDGNSDHEEIEQILSVTKSRVVKGTLHMQIPGKAGDLQRPPKFCIKGCPSRIEDWESATEQFANTDVRMNPFVNTLARLEAPNPRTSLRFMKVALAQADTSFPPVQEPRHIQDADTAPENVRRKLRVDILYCAGDETAKQRQAKAARIEAYLNGLKGGNSPVAGFEIGDVKLVPVPPKINQTLYRANDSAIIYNEGSPALYDWAQEIRSTVSPPLRLAGKPGSASDYLSIVVCDAADLSARPATIYVQVASDLQKTTAQALQAVLKNALPGATVPRGIEVVRTSPNLTEVRYFTPAQKADATRAADAVSGALRSKVKARYIPGYEDKLKDSSVIELWLGKKETATVPDKSE